MKKAKRIVMWFRHDLRLHDNEALTCALQRGEEVIPVYVFDERQLWGETSWGLRKTGEPRARFLIEAVIDLREGLRRLGVDLVVRVGKPEEAVFQLARQLRSSCVYANMERTDEEVQVQEALERNLWTIGQEIHFCRGKMLYYTQDLPFPISQTPDTFSNFRKEVERIVPVRDPLPAPEAMPMWSCAVEVGEIPGLATFYPEAAVEAVAVGGFRFRGGERAGLERLRYYFEGMAIARYDETRQELLGVDNTTRLSAWLAAGCVSPKTVYQQIKQYEQGHPAHKNATYALFLELLWRDFFRLMGKKYSGKLFQRGGITGYETKPLVDDVAKWQQWMEGQTGVPFLDAMLLELRTTGYLSHRGRQNISSYLVNDMGVNWQMGAEYFESILIDYDVCTTWINWMQVGGVGNDLRDERQLHIVSQAKRYDPKGEYIKYWLPHLQDIQADTLHQAGVAER